MTIDIQSPLDLRLMPVLFSLLLLGACRATPDVPECDENDGAYLAAPEQSALRVPEGMAAPDRRTAMTIPVANGKAIDRKVCYQRAPSYFGTAGRIAASPEETVADWAQAWSERNAPAVMAMYSRQFVTDAPAGGAAWLAQREQEVANGPLPGGRVTNLKITQQGSDQRLATFTQQFGDSKVVKLLRMERDAGVWKIVSEQVVTAETESGK